jgi:hypothetical protein
MNVNDLLCDGACFDALVNTAAVTSYGGLITVGELVSALDSESDESAKVLMQILKPLPTGTIAAKVYTKGSNLRVIGLAVHAVDGVAGVCGYPLPKGVTLSKTKEKRGNGDKEYSVPIARLSVTTMTDDDEPEVVSLDFDFAKPSTAKDYFEWCAESLDTGKAEFIASGIGEWSEPSLATGMGGDRVNLEQIPPGKYQITALESEVRTSKAGKPYTVWSLAVNAADREFSTWARVMPRGCDVGVVQQKMLALGKVLVLDVRGLREQRDKYGGLKLDKDNNPYMELDGRIYASTEMPKLSPSIVMELAPSSSASSDDDEMPF